MAIFLLLSAFFVVYGKFKLTVYIHPQTEAETESWYEQVPEQEFFQQNDIVEGKKYKLHWIRQDTVVLSVGNTIEYSGYFYLLLMDSLDGDGKVESVIPKLYRVLIDDREKDVLLPGTTVFFENDDNGTIHVKVQRKKEEKVPESDKPPASIGSGNSIELI